MRKFHKKVEEVHHRVCRAQAQIERMERRTQELKALRITEERKVEEKEKESGKDKDNEIDKEAANDGIKDKEEATKVKTEMEEPPKHSGYLTLWQG